MLRKRGVEMIYHLPCAGITLVRFYGFDLSPFRLQGRAEHPEESERIHPVENYRKTSKVGFFASLVTF